MLNILLDVSPVNDMADSCMSAFVFPIDADMLDRMKSVAKLVKDNKLLSASVFYHGGDWLSCEADDVIDGCLHQPWVNNLVELAGGDEITVRIDIPEMVIYSDSVYFTCTPKHGSDAETHRTRTIYLGDLLRLESDIRDPELVGGISYLSFFEEGEVLLKRLASNRTTPR